MNLQKPNEDQGSKKQGAPQRRPRPFGSLILLGTILIVIFLILKGTSPNDQKEITQDEFEYILLSGRVEKLVFEGQSHVTGTYRPTPTLEPQGFKVAYHDLSSKDAWMRLRAAEATPRTMKVGEFLEKATAENAKQGSPERFIANPDFLPMRFDVLHFTSSGKSELAKKAGTHEVLVKVLTDGVEQRYTLEGEGGKSPDLTSIFELYRDLKKPSELETAQAFPIWEENSFKLSSEFGSKYKVDNNLWTQVLVSFAPWFIILLVFYFFIIRQMRNPGGGGGILSFGRSRALLYTKENRTNVTFDDVAGVEEAKDEVGEIIEFLKNPQRFQRLGGRIPRGILLAGPPGTGKTLLAKAIAGEAEVPFFSISGSDFVEMFVGVGASRVRDLFRQAKENSPCIIFLDEIDAVGRKRGSGLGGGHDEREQTLNAILVEMDGFETDDGVIVVAATNRPDVLDTALMRPGRFDREIVIDPPDVKGREQILRVHSRRVKLDPGADLSVIAKSTPGYSGADLAAVINEAAIIAVMKNHEWVQIDDLEEAREKVRFGRQKRSRKMEEEDKIITSYHESGHALVATILEDTEPVHKVTIIPRGMALGATMTLPERDRIFMQRKKLLSDLAVLYGGRIAEEIFCSDITAGAQNDIQRATMIARLMICEWGMSDRLGPVSYAEKQGTDFLGHDFPGARHHSEETAKQIDEEVRSILDRAYTQAREIISSRQETMHAMAKALLKYETLTGEEVEAIVKGQDVDQIRAEREARETKAREEREREAKSAELDRPEAKQEPEPDLRGNEGFSPA